MNSHSELIFICNACDLDRATCTYVKNLPVSANTSDTFFTYLPVDLMQTLIVSTSGTLNRVSGSISVALSGLKCSIKFAS